MKRRLADLLRCPDCNSAFTLTVFSTRADERPVRLASVRCQQNCALLGSALRDSSLAPDARTCERCYGEDVVDGLLRCEGCRAVFPVVESVPRLLPSALFDHPRWVARWGAGIDKGGSARPLPQRRAFERSFRRTQRSFEFEWLTFRETWDNDLENFWRRTGFHREDLAGWTVLDAGCGMGRYLRLLGDVPGCEIVGLDLGRAVERAQADIAPTSPYLHLVQGNLMTPPFRREAFDLVYSLGVLHHTPSTATAFRAIAPLARRGGHLAIWVYARDMLRHPIRLAVSDALRFVTIRLPPRAVYWLAHIAAPLGWLQERLIKRRVTMWLGAPLLALPVRIRAPWRIRVMDTYDWYSPRFQWKHTRDEVRGWFEQAGFVDIEPCVEEVSCQGRRPGGPPL
ncbi:MAG: hypothetical protein A3I00_05415 [Betaproteobacteria bacterium RIFCSPLOWO2_02_FULL_64_12]|nr:MAG: hypothetical protein A3I00_05415 [Betaproteobacteria bacterium RIFCSPLOWO2_02_FULL_64_12]